MTNHDFKRFPIGRFASKASYTKEEEKHFIETIAALPDSLSKSILNLSSTQLNTPYREGGWTLLQVVHHLADSHMNAYIRFKWTLTENKPTIKAYNENEWATTFETTQSTSLSINLLTALHQKWVVLLSSLSEADLERSYIHPESKREITLQQMMALYAWHGEHHVAHITSLRLHMNW